MRKEEEDNIDEEENTKEEFDFPRGLYHRITLSDGTRSIDCFTPSDHMDFKAFMQHASSLMLFMSDDEYKKKIKEGVSSDI